MRQQREREDKLELDKLVERLEKFPEAEVAGTPLWQKAVQTEAKRNTGMGAGTTLIRKIHPTEIV
jgi:hypothetical protein